jgi:hypothetical protein
LFCLFQLLLLYPDNFVVFLCQAYAVIKGEKPRGVLRTNRKRGK